MPPPMTKRSEIFLDSSDEDDNTNVWNSDDDEATLSDKDSSSSDSDFGHYLNKKQATASNNKANDCMNTHNQETPCNNITKKKTSEMITSPLSDHDFHFDDDDNCMQMNTQEPMQSPHNSSLNKRNNAVSRTGELVDSLVTLIAPGTESSKVDSNVSTTCQTLKNQKKIEKEISVSERKLINNNNLNIKLDKSSKITEIPKTGHSEDTQAELLKNDDNSVDLVVKVDDKIISPERNDSNKKDTATSNRENNKRNKKLKKDKEVVLNNKQSAKSDKKKGDVDITSPSASKKAVSSTVAEKPTKSLSPLSKSKSTKPNSKPEQAKKKDNKKSSDSITNKKGSNPIENQQVVKAAQIFNSSTETKMESSSKTISNKSKSGSSNSSSSSSTTVATSSVSLPKKKKHTFQSQVLLHLLTTLRPFTLKTLATELRSTTVALQHLMLSLVDKGIVKKREWGKNNKELYWVDVDNALKEVYGKDYQLDEKEKEDAKLELQQLRTKEFMLNKETESMNIQISNQELDKQLKDEEDIVIQLRSRLNGAKERIAGIKRNQNPCLGSRPIKQMRVTQSSNSGGIKQQQSQMRSAPQVKKEFNFMRTEWKNRKQKCMDFVETLSDAMEKKPKEVIKLLELETDEAMGVKLPPKQDV